MSGTRTTRCPGCDEAAPPDARFCEACGAALDPSTAPDPAPAPAPERSVASSTTWTRPPSATCRACGGRVSADGYCDTCGTPTVPPRDHWAESPAPWVAGVCDRGVRHARNEDAMAIAVTGDRAVLVVCDGVSSAPDSDIASLAAATAARDALVDPAGARTSDALVAAAAAAEQAILDHVGDRAQRVDPPSCTFVASVVEGSRATTAWLGDSRAYWVPDGATAVPLTVDDSWVEEMVARGIDRAQAESSSQAHAITRWLGPDSGDHPPRVVEHDLDTPGWLLLCSDGLWNYCPDAATLTDVVRQALAPVDGGPADGGPATPASAAQRLVRWAVEQGGADNITVVLARHDGDTLHCDEVSDDATNEEP
ncbi:serine/threonine protein phosphatase PrpC [Sediminihabitans luteus]|uniref:Serine/threonine protein phosphatase PrpC n=1 Tax=Sediminihabitans luteus TaxID=1138585 RepID=A0A2M9CY55_9CELL|nr:PP2C family serine/threonine-protein phosphatase [Sediminihabitans luteus]PJJ76866.1 serine/threonine protein phosphatase PrpC [Sediminihabitans luteus]GIJ00346.1 hypothetical protein Slu03_27230 [Sediminihabitans luteus]